MAYFALFYDVVDGFREKRTPLRPSHLALVRDAQARGELVMAGALGDPPEGALLVFTADDGGPAERFAHADPYVIGGLVTRWRVVPWNVVTGGSTGSPRAQR